MMLTKEQRDELGGNLKLVFDAAWWPLPIFAAAVDGYFEAFFAVMHPGVKK